MRNVLLAMVLALCGCPKAQPVDTAKLTIAPPDEGQVIAATNAYRSFLSAARLSESQKVELQQLLDGDAVAFLEDGPERTADELERFVFTRTARFLDAGQERQFESTLHGQVTVLVATDIPGANTWNAR